MPSHNHKYKIPCGGQNCKHHGPGFHLGGAYADYPDKNSMFNSGGDQPHNNMPPFYALAFIMKIFPVPKESNENKPEPKFESKPDLNNDRAMNNII